MLELDQLHAGYGQHRVLRGVRFSVRPGEIVALLGRNGAGRSTTAKAIMGLVPATGLLRWNGQDLLQRTTSAIARLGIGYVPESRDVFPRLTVHENLLLGQKGSAARRRGAGAFDDMYAMFPQLEARAHTEAGLLSGGEQQMLTLCRTLMGDPALIVVDEPTEGLAPQVVALVADALVRLRARGVGVLLIEQKLTVAMAISDRVLVMGHGRIVFDGTPAALRENTAIRDEWLAV